MPLEDSICHFRECVIVNKLPVLEMCSVLVIETFIGYHYKGNMNGNSLLNISLDTWLHPYTARVGYLHPIGFR